jgi:EmrB/QacA subfamily drug resistance transporter
MTDIGTSPPRAARTQQASDRTRWAALALLCLAQFMLILDITAVNVALPSMATDLALSREALTWVVTSYTVSFGGLMILGGRLADGVGARRMMLTGLVVFVAASAATGLAHNTATLLGGRIGQGVGAALLSPAALAIVTSVFRGTDRAKALAVWGGLAGAGSALGNVLGGVLTAGPGWRWIFYVNLPVGMLVLVTLPALVAARPAAPARLDVPGAVLVTGGTGALIYGLATAGSAGWESASTLVPLAVAAGLYALFALIERQSARPLLDVRMFARRPVVIGAFLMLTGTGLLFGYFFLGSIYLQHLRGYSALTTGLLFLPMAVAAGVGAQLAGRLTPALGTRTLAVAALALVAAGSGLLTQLSATGSPWITLLPGLVVGALGVGAIFVTATSTALANVPDREAGLASGVINTCHEVGGGIGIAILSTIAAAGITRDVIGGFTRAFTLAALVAILAALTSVFLIPASKAQSPDDGGGHA